MSGDNRNIITPPPTPPLFAIYTVGFQDNVNYANQCFHPDDPPPKYEDAIKGEDLKPNYSRCTYPPTPTASPAYQSIDLNAHSIYAHTNTAQSEHSSEENDKGSNCSTLSILVICFIVILLVMRVSALLSI